MTNTLSVENAVYIANQLDIPSLYISTAGIPTKYEIYGMVILEALFFGVPVIASKEAGPISIIREDWLGTCINLNTDDWTSAIIKYSYSYRSSNLYQAKRKKYVLDNFNWEKIANDFLIEINTKKSNE